MIKIFSIYKEMRKWRQRAVDAKDLNKYWEKTVNDMHMTRRVTTCPYCYKASATKIKEGTSGR